MYYYGTLVWKNSNGSRTIHQKSPLRLNGFTRSYVDRRICNFYEWSPSSFPPCPVLGIRSPNRSLTRLIVKHSHRDRYCSPMVGNIFQCLITRICGTICRWHRSTRMYYAYNGTRKYCLNAVNKTINNENMRNKFLVSWGKKYRYYICTNVFLFLVKRTKDFSVIKYDCI